MAEIDDNVLLADGLDTALLGFADMHDGQRVAIYDMEKVIDILMERDGMDREDAVEFFDFNIAGSYIGPGTPLFMDRVAAEHHPAAAQEARDT